MTLTNLSTELKKIALPSTDPERLAAALAKQRERMAADLGMCQADCPVCEGIGYVRVGDGTLELCPNVNRWKLASAARYGISQQEADTLDWSGVMDVNGAARAVEAVQRALAWGFGWVYLYGDFGVGKTHILKIAIAQALRNNQDAAYVRMAEIMDNLREGFDDKAEGETARLRWWSGLKVLAIDEFEKVRASGYGDERQFVLMDRRYEMAIRQEGVTLIASNSDPASLPGYLYDRVRDGRFQMIRITGESLRPGMDWA
jgi:DNA replication protein DnaC